MAGLKDINYSQPGNTGIPVQISDLQQLWEAFDAFATSVDATTPRIISGFEDTSTGGLTGGIIAFNNKAYYLPNGQITSQANRHLYVNSVDDTNSERVAENSQRFNFYKNRVVNTAANGSATDKGTYIGEATAANIALWKGTFVLADGIVTTSKLADNSVSTSKIINSAVTGAKIASKTITRSNIAAGTITSTEVASRSLLPDNIAAPVNAVQFTTDREPYIVQVYFDVFFSTPNATPTVNKFGLPQGFSYTLSSLVNGTHNSITLQIEPPASFGGVIYAYNVQVHPFFRGTLPPGGMTGISSYAIANTASGLLIDVDCYDWTWETANHAACSVPISLWLKVDHVNIPGE